MVLPGEAGTQSVYGEWLLQQTERLLPKSITLPDDIPDLVQEAYAMPAAEKLNDPAWCSYTAKLAAQEIRASSFRLQKCQESRRAKMNTINAILDTDAPDDEIYGEASVRDGNPSIEVLMLMQYDNGNVGLIPRNGEAPSFDPTREPSYGDAMRIARQRIRLPHELCRNINEIITFLEEKNRRTLSEWQHASALRGELFLLLDERLTADLGNYTLQYSPEFGLRYWKGGNQENE